MVAEYSTIVAPQSEAKISYLTNDHLGSPRIITNELGQVTSRRDFMPFGEEISSAQRTSGLNYSADNIRQKFTGYERDTETDLDFAQARYYNKNLGRFSSPDEPFLDQSEFQPQSWNLYSYVRNNPLNLTDPFGTKAGCPNGPCPDVCPTGKVCELDKDGKIISVEDDKEPTVVETSVERPWYEKLADVVLSLFNPRGCKIPKKTTPQQKSLPQVRPQPQTRDSVLIPRTSLPSASQRLPNMNGMSRTQAESQLRSEGFTLKSTTGGGNQKWTHSDGSEVWVKNSGEVSRIPTTSAAQQFGATGKHQGVRADAETGQIMRSSQHHQVGTIEVVY